MEQVRQSLSTEVSSRPRAFTANGYNRGIPRETVAAWGGRWIITQSGVVEAIAEKQGASGTYHERKTITDYYNKVVGDKAMVMAAALLTDGTLHTDDDREAVLYEDERFIVKANPMSSCGYLYVCAYFKPGRLDG